MADAELGQKRACPSCSRKFYDLAKVPAECPYCGATFNPDDLIRGRNRKPAAPEEAKSKAAEKPAGDGEAPEEEVTLPEGLEDVDVDSDGDEDDDVLEDASDLGEDDSDLDEVMEHVEKPEKEA
ncbi:MAG: TIGR02300 family protein [Rhodospirillaceae bacterium]|nr:TIGR02300 family protein [Rhodospirillaceae bacterium]